jgi:HlyD family secretion protein
MDIPRKGAARARMIRRIVAGVLVVAGVIATSVALGRLKPAAPEVERGTAWIGTVKRGPMLREVRGLGALVPEDVLWIPATTQGRVEKIHVRPGTAVKPDTILMEMSNPVLEQEMLDAEYQLKSAEAAYTDLRVRLESQRLTQEADVARIQADYTQARLRADRDQELGKLGLKPDLEVRIQLATAEELANRHKIEQKRLEISAESIQAQLAAQKVLVEQKRALYELKKRQVGELKVRAGSAGVLQQLGNQPAAGAGGTIIEVGQQVAPGTILAKVAQPWKLKAELKIPETQAKDILLGLPAQIDTRNGVIPGRVVRIDPAVVNGTRTVDVKLEGALPTGAVPELSVDGAIQIEKLDDVVYVERPVFGQAHSLVTLFKVEPDGRHASRVQVKLGRSSVNTIEIVEGLQPGDRVVLSDMSAWDAHHRIRLH